MKKHDRFMYTALAVAILIFVAFFATFWFDPTHIPHNFGGLLHIFDVILYMLVTFVVWHPIMMAVLSLAIVGYIEPVPKRLPPPAGLRVAFVTTFVPASESIELLHKTLPAMLRADYPHDTWILDEGNDPRVKTPPPKVVA